MQVNSMRTAVLGAVFASVLVACGQGGNETAEPAPAPTEGVETVTATISRYTVDTLAYGLEDPWGMAQLPGGDILITERGGALKRIETGTGEVSLLSGVPQVLVYGQGGLWTSPLPQKPQTLRSSIFLM